MTSRACNEQPSSPSFHNHNSNAQLSSSIDLGENLSSLSYFHEKRIMAVAGVKQAHLVTLREFSGGVTLSKAGSIGGIKPDHIAWKPGSDGTLAISDRIGPICIFDAVVMEKSSGEWIARPEQKQVASLTSRYRASTCIAWNPHQTHLLACSAPDFVLGMWDTRTQPNSSSGGEFRFGIEGNQGNDIAFSPFQPHLVAVASQAANTGTLMLFDQRKLSMSLASINTPGYCTAVAFHPTFSDLLVYSYKVYGNRRDTKIDFLHVNVNPLQAPSLADSPAASASATLRQGALQQVPSSSWVTCGPQPALPSIVAIAPTAKLRWRPVPFRSKLSPLWFASCASQTDTDANVWDAFNAFTPVLAARNLHLDADLKPQVIADIAWLNSSSLVTCSKFSRSLVLSTMHDGLMWSHQEALPTASSCLSTLGNIISVRDVATLRSIYEADMCSTTHHADTTSERSVNLASSTPMYSPQGIISGGSVSSTMFPPVQHVITPTPVSATAGITSHVGAQASTASGTQAATTAKKEKKSWLSGLFSSDDKAPSKGAAHPQPVAPSHQSSAPPPAAVTSTPHLQPQADPFTVSPPTHGSAGFPANVGFADAPPVLFSDALPQLQHLRTAKANAVLESTLLRPANIPYSNYVVRTPRRVFKLQAHKWDDQYEYCVARRRREDLDADDMFHTESAAEVDRLFGAIFLANSDVSRRAGLPSDDPRVCLWGSIGLLFAIHDCDLVVAQVLSALRFASDFGDMQMATFMYITTVLWWRHRALALASERTQSTRDALEMVSAFVLLQSEWKEKAFEWVDAYAALLVASDSLWVEWNELAYVFPYAVRTSARKPDCFENPCFNVAHLNHEKSTAFVHCGSCGKVVSVQEDKFPDQLASDRQRHGSRLPQATCSTCRSKPLHVCIICEQIVQGAFLWMKPCGHGGHAQHIVEWLEENNDCPKCGAVLQKSSE